MVEVGDGHVQAALEQGVPRQGGGSRLCGQVCEDRGAFRTSSYHSQQVSEADEPVAQAHYFVNNGFMEDGHLLKRENIDKIRNIPAVIIQDRYDCVCPAKTAWDLHKVWPEAEYVGCDVLPPRAPFPWDPLSCLSTLRHLAQHECNDARVAFIDRRPGRGSLSDGARHRAGTHRRDQQVCTRRSLKCYRKPRNESLVAQSEYRCTACCVITGVADMKVRVYSKKG